MTPTDIAIEHRASMAPLRGSATSVGSVALVIGVLVTGLLAFGIVGLAAVACVGGLVLPVANGNLRSALLRSAERRARVARHHARERALMASPWGRVALCELAKLVDDIELRAPNQPRYIDLETLLDQHVALTLAHEQALRATGMAERTQLERLRDIYRSNPRVDAQRLDLCERRIHCLDECEAVAASIASELAIVAETIRLIAQRVACPDAPGHSQAIDRQLAELDEADAARPLPLQASS